RLPYLPMVLPPAPRPQPRAGVGADAAASRPGRRPLRDARRAVRGADARRAAGVDLLQHRAGNRLRRPLPRGLRRTRAPRAVGAARPRAARALLHAEPRPARGPRPRRPRRLRRRHPGHDRRRAGAARALTAGRAALTRPASTNGADDRSSAPLARSAGRYTTVTRVAPARGSRFARTRGRRVARRRLDHPGSLGPSPHFSPVAFCERQGRAISGRTRPSLLDVL